LLDRPHERGRLGAAARRRAVAAFDVRHAASKLLEQYALVLSPDRRPATGKAGAGPSGCASGHRERPSDTSICAPQRLGAAMDSS
jgi:hypothetical protein